MDLEQRILREKKKLERLAARLAAAGKPRAKRAARRKLSPKAALASAREVLRSVRGHLAGDDIRRAREQATRAITMAAEALPLARGQTAIDLSDIEWFASFLAQGPLNKTTLLRLAELAS